MKQETRYRVPQFHDEAVFRSLDDAKQFSDEMGFDWVVEMESFGPFPTGPSGRQWAKDEDGWFDLPEGICMCDECLKRNVMS